MPSDLVNQAFEALVAERTKALTEEIEKLKKDKKDLRDANHEMKRAGAEDFAIKVLSRLIILPTDMEGKRPTERAIEEVESVFRVAEKTDDLEAQIERLRSEVEAAGHRETSANHQRDAARRAREEDLLNCHLVDREVRAAHEALDATSVPRLSADGKTTYGVPARIRLLAERKTTPDHHAIVAVGIMRAASVLSERVGYARGQKSEMAAMCLREIAEELRHEVGNLLKLSAKARKEEDEKARDLPVRVDDAGNVRLEGSGAVLATPEVERSPT